jgi:hypothetical protein
MTAGAAHIGAVLASLLLMHACLLAAHVSSVPCWHDWRLLLLLLLALLWLLRCCLSLLFLL